MPAATEKYILLRRGILPRLGKAVSLGLVRSGVWWSGSRAGCSDNNQLDISKRMTENECFCGQTIKEEYGQCDWPFRIANGFVIAVSVVPI